MRSWTNGLLGALERKGQTFAIVDISTLLSPDGVLAALRAANAIVDIPPDEVPR